MLVFVGSGVFVEGRSFWLPGLRHRLLHQKTGDDPCGGAAADLPERSAGERKQRNQQRRSDATQPLRTEEERSG